LEVGVDSAIVTVTSGAVVTTDAGDRFALDHADRVTVLARPRGLVVREWPERPAYHRITLSPRRATVPALSVGDRLYRGTVEFVEGESGLSVVNVLPVEEYLPGVVGAELGRGRGELAALEAQAVASRTYVLRNMGRFAALGFDVRAGTSDQAYLGVAAESGVVVRAVRATRGEVAVHDGELIHAFFHSTCGPVTASPTEAYRSVRPEPYLQPVSDARPGGGYYSDGSPWFAWTTTWSGPELQATLRRWLPRVVGIDPTTLDTLRDIYIVHHGPSGRATELRVVVSGGEIPVFGPDIRNVLRRSDGSGLPSTLFRLEVERADGQVSRLTATGSGYGHGVGLCQWGAIGRARAGYDYRDIVGTYYQGAVIERWY